MFIDEVVVTLVSGKGGDGCISFRREKYIPFGGPNGGDGGDGGHVVLLADENVGDLTAFRYTPIHKAKPGGQGRGSDQNGKRGPNKVLKVPLGTVVIDKNTGMHIKELLAHEEEFIICKGGSGGWGNTHFKSSVNQTPRRANPGTDGEQGEFKLVLKIIADIGLVGFPNAGKSSLTNLITRAHPTVADYPFTTLNPHIGIIEYKEEYRRLVLADIPGLISGASENRGLGHRFLRHIERCKLLCLIVDMAGIDGRDPADDYAELMVELENYDPALLEKPRLVVANKMDEDAASKNLKAFSKRHAVAVSPISCLSEEGIPELLRKFLDEVTLIQKAEAELEAEQLTAEAAD
ncbi:MAG: GTPase ObgE [Verrucomicrobia bacterium]|nr:GTPase ObgE [Verrucomicrobiota bacterium]MDA1066066.1 GTPase ObgE [Verrucomicrobiota bacterium]